MDLGIKNKNALITGGGRGLGKQIALDLAKEDVNVCIISRTEKELQSVCEEITNLGKKATYRVFDLVKGDYQELKKSINEELGSIDILVNNASKQTIPKKISFMDENDWYKTIDTDLNSQFKIVKTFIDDMKNNNWGRIIFVGSLSAVVGVANYPAYCTVKAALDGFVKNLAVDYSKYGINTNMISPGFILTERFEKNAPKEFLEKFAQATSIKRLPKPEEISSTITFLVSQKASYITGVNIPVCGGLNLGNLW
ncbi:MAG: SDR family oxidoreductase [Candidatus Sericytochromatia bacterium]